jgi:D-threo-aldose 1-dehydrogenase
MTLISTARVGRTRLHVLVLGLGAAPLGGAPFTPISDTEAVETVRYALANGVTFFDTAPKYGAGLSERRVGMALAGAPRDSYVLATKVGRLVTPEGRTTVDFSRDGVLRSIEASLDRLQIGRIDI